MRTPAPTPSTSSPSSSPTTTHTTSPTSGASRRRVHRTLALAGTAMLFGGAALAAAAPAQAAGAVLDPVQVERSCKTPGKSGSPDKAYYSSVVLRGSATGDSTFTFDFLTVKNNPALTQITPKTVTVPAGSTTTVTIQATGAQNSANGPAVLASTVNQGGTTSQHTGTISTFAPMQTTDCGVTFPSNVNKPWPVGTTKVIASNPVSGDYVPPAAQSGVTAVNESPTFQMALKTDGTVVAWGRNDYGEATPPAGLNNVKAISSGSDYALALQNDGTVVGWGLPRPAMTAMNGKTGMASISANAYWAVGVTTQGGVVAAGNTDEPGPAWVPAGLDSGVTQAVASGQGAMALKSDGTVVVWRDIDTWTRETVPVPANVNHIVSIATGYDSTHAALKDDGTVLKWNDGETTATTVATGAKAIVMDDSGDALFVFRPDGTVDNGDGTAAIPTFKGATALSTRVGGYIAIVPSA